MRETSISLFDRYSAHDATTLRGHNVKQLEYGPQESAHQTWPDGTTTADEVRILGVGRQDDADLGRAPGGRQPAGCFHNRRVLVRVILQREDDTDQQRNHFTTSRTITVEIKRPAATVAALRPERPSRALQAVL